MTKEGGPEIPGTPVNQGAGTSKQEPSEAGGTAKPFVWTGIAVSDIATYMVQFKRPPLISLLLSKHKTLSLDVLTLYESYVQGTLNKKTVSNNDREFLQDYNKYRPQLQSMLEAESDGAQDTVYEELITDTANLSITQREKSIAPLNRNKLFIDPENFDGKKNARKWLNDFEYAAQQNDWSERQKLKYFPAFLTETARTWYTTMALQNSRNTSNWLMMRQAFFKFYLGTDDVFSLQKEIDQCYQGERESITSFIPRYIELIKLLDPHKPEDQLVMMIRMKLSSYLQKQLAPFYITRVEELTTMCLRLEKASASAWSASKRERTTRDQKLKKQPTTKYENNKSKENNSKKTEKSEQKSENRHANKKKNTIDPSKKDIKCYRCENMGHYSNECKSTRKKNGDPIEPKPAKINAVGSSVPAATNPTPTPSQTTNFVSAPSIRNAGNHCNLTNTVMLCNGQDGLLTTDLEINGIQVVATVDTGAKVSVIHDDLVKANLWQVNGKRTPLCGPTGERMECLGTLRAKLALTVGVTTMALEADIVVVAGLKVTMLLGIDLIRALKIVINVNNVQRPFSFEKSAIKKGLRLKTETILPPRSLNFVTVVAQTAASAIATRPYNIDDAIILANSVDIVRENESHVMLGNLDSEAIRLKKGTQVASFDEFIEREETLRDVNSIGTIMRIGDSSETVKIGEQLSKEQLNDLTALLADHIEAFSVNGQLGEAKITQHEIVLREGAKPVAEPLRRRPHLHVEEANKQVKAMLAEGIIEPSSSPWAAAYVVVKKKTGDWRLCVDFRGLNAVTKMDSYPLPLIENCIEAVANKSYYSLLDFASGYWQIPIHPNSKELTAFRCERGLYQFRRMPFGLSTAPASFQRLMNGLFAGLTGLNLQCFIDDVCLATETWPEHLQLLSKVFKIVIKANLKLKGSKCLIGANQVTFLGHQISKDGIRTDPKKLQAIQELPRPTDVKAVRRVVGLLSYYRKFVPRFAILAEPLTSLTRKSSKFVWEEKQENAFRALINELAKNATLSNLNAQDPVLLKTDASGVGIAGILLQRQEGLWRMICCASRKLLPAETRYGITDLEALAIVYSVKKFRHYLLGRFFTIMTDHHALCVLTSKTPASDRLQRWALILSEFQYKVVYTKGSEHKDVDCLSRAPVNDEDPFAEQIFTVPEVVEHGEPKVTWIPVNKSEWQDAIDDDEEGVELLDKATSREDGFELKGDLIYRAGKLYVPRPKRQTILRESHDSSFACHDGIEGTKNRLAGVWWPNMSQTIADYVKSCEICQRRKAGRSKPSGYMRPHESKEPMGKICFDYVGPLPETIRKKRFILVGIDVFSRFIFAKALSDQTAARFCKYFVQLCGQFGVPRTVVTDNAKTFDNADFKQLTAMYDIKHVFAASRYSQGNAPAERAIQSLSEKISMLTTDETMKLQWDTVIPSAVLSINTKVCKTTKYTPYELMFGREHVPIQPSLTTASDYDHGQALLRLDYARMRANESARQMHEQNKAYFDAKRVSNSFQTDDLVWVKRSDRRQKLSERFEGPFRIESIENDICKLRHSVTNQTREKHSSQLKRHHERPVMTAVPLILLVLAGAGLAQSAAPISWEPVEDRFVSDGHETKFLEIVYANPCFALDRLQRAIKLDPMRHRFNNTLGLANLRGVPMMHQTIMVPVGVQQLQQQALQQQQQPRQPLNQLLGNAIQQTQFVQPKSIGRRPVEEHNTETKRTENEIQREKRQANDNIQAAMQQCNRAYEQFLHTLERFHMTSKREAYLAAAAGAAGYYYLSNFFSDVKHKYFDQPELEEQHKDKILSDAIHRLNARLDVQDLLNQYIRADLRQSSEWLSHLTESVNYLITVEPEIAAITGMIIGRIREKASIYDRLYTSLRLKSVDMIALAQLTLPEFFSDIHFPDAKLQRLQCTPLHHLQVVVAGPRRSRDTQVFKVNAIDHMARVNGTIRIRKYDGPKWLIRNLTSDCVVGIDPIVTKHTTRVCKDPHARDPRLKEWELFNQDEKPIPFSILEAWPHIVIQCWPFNVSITKPFQRMIECPLEPIAINASWTFSTTNDNGYVHVGSETEKEGMLDMDFHVSEVHLNDFELNRETQQDKEMGRLVEEMKELHINSTLFDSQMLRITHRQATGGLAGVLIFAVGAWLLLKVLQIVDTCWKQAKYENPRFQEDNYATQLEMRQRIRSMRSSR